MKAKKQKCTSEMTIQTYYKIIILDSVINFVQD